jgi:hypothetical protein
MIGICLFIIMIIFLLTIYWIFNSLIYRVEPFSNYITLPQIRDRIRHLIFVLGINPNKITRNNLFTIIKNYKHLFPRIPLTRKYISDIFTKLDIDKKGSIDYITVSYLYFYKNNYIDRDIYYYNKIQERMQNSKINNNLIPYNGNKLTNYFQDFNIKSTNTNKKTNIVVPYQLDLYPNTGPIITQPQQLLRINNCAREYQNCFSNNKNISYYGLNNLK